MDPLNPSKGKSPAGNTSKEIAYHRMIAMREQYEQIAQMFQKDLASKLPLHKSRYVKRTAIELNNGIQDVIRAVSITAGFAKDDNLGLCKGSVRWCPILIPRPDMKTRQKMASGSFDENSKK